MAAMERERDIVEDKFRYQWSILIPKRAVIPTRRVGLVSLSLGPSQRAGQETNAEVVFRSPMITRPNHNQWQLEIRPYNFQTTSGAARGMRVKMNCSILDEKSEHTLHTKQSEVCTVSDLCKEVNISKFGEGYHLESHLPENSTHSFLFEVVVYKGTNAQNSSPYVSLVMGTQLASAREESLLTDFTLVVDGEEFKAHKFILAARSPVFRKMFEVPMRENEEASVTIDDFSAEVVEEMLTFLYSEKAPNIKEMAAELLAIAEKYQIEDLKLLCGQEMDRCLTIDNATETLIYADVYNVGPLKSACINFVAIHYPEVQKTEDWPTVVSEHQPLYTEVLEEVCRRCSNEPAPPPSKKACINYNPLL